MRPEPGIWVARERLGESEQLEDLNWPMPGYAFWAKAGNSALYQGTCIETVNKYK